eukprot:CAMPEP_0117440674 /NCGR_PEP_ID=MMETSP0759-20121206/3220_1 /TAXON_ID=63605 /ORGANISM="Percolomonas cosmopolitus, Strain WS" /LENGTH=548 /DNA_ID=CAMNT_0005232463 /DNA_START=169 /DNA_END=1816 /DNA_ORIENTATION=+
MTSSEKETVTYTEGGEKLITTKTDDADQLAKLYEAYEELERLAGKAGENKDAFKTILNGTKQTQSAKTLAAGFIPKYFKYFDDLQTEALDSFLDLVEEESTQIRTAAVRGISQICRDKPQYVTQMANVLGQLLPDAEIETVVTESFLSLLETDAKAAIEALCQHISNDEDKELRSKAISFLLNKILGRRRRADTKTSSILDNPEVEELIINNLTPLLKKVDWGEEFANILHILRKIPKYQKGEGAAELYEILVERTGLDLENFDATNTETLQTLVDVFPTVLQFARAGVDHTNMLLPMVNSALPNYKTYEPEVTYRVLQSIADSAPHVNADTAKQILPQVYTVLLEHLPEPVEGQEPEYNFSFLEALLYAFHACGSRAPGALNPLCGIKVFTGQPDEDTNDYPEKRENFAQRLKLFLEKTTAYYNRYKTQRIEEPAPTASEEEKQNFIEEKKQAAMRNRLLRNLQEMTRPLTYSTPKLVNVKFNINDPGDLLAKRGETRESPVDKEADQTNSREATTDSDVGAEEEEVVEEAEEEEVSNECDRTKQRC